MTITNDTIIKAAKAAGLDVREDKRGSRMHLMSIGSNTGVFDPLNNDTDNAMIRRGAEIDVRWFLGSKDVDSIASDGKGQYFDRTDNYVSKGKAQAEREGVILCAAAKWDAMNKGVKLSLIHI